ncbi:uncharacterized protein [Eucyclogobius newberryi]|uniref:uncharacterized protein n=1 Tax=Eucyclogobius newberryi TaxID=166745 RepID=UPI003B5B0E0D
MNKTLEAEVNHNDKVCHNVRGQVEAQMKRLQEQESEIETLKLELGNCRREIKHLEQMKLEVSLANDQLLQSPEKHPNSGQKQDDCDSFSRKDVCQVLQKEISDQEQRKCHERQDRLKLKLRHVKFKLKDEMEWRDEKIGELKRELSLCSHALTLEKELNMDVMMENDKLLIEKRRLVQQLNEEVCLFVQQPETHPHSAPFQVKVGHSTTVTRLGFNSCVFLQFRLGFLELENRELQNRIADLCAQSSSTERSLRNLQSLRVAESSDWLAINMDGLTGRRQARRYRSKTRQPKTCKLADEVEKLIKLGRTTCLKVTPKTD